MCSARTVGETSTEDPTHLSTDAGIVYRQFGRGTPLVLLHGSAGSWRHWERNIDALSRYRAVFVPDLPGYGDSMDVQADVTVDAYVDLVMRAIDDMCAKEEPIDVIGFSFGGLIAAGCASQLGARARRLALLTPSGFDAPKGRVLDVPRRSEFEGSEDAEREFHRRMLLATMLADPASADAQAVDIQRYNAKRARFNGRRFSWSGRLLPLLQKIPCPLQVIYGDSDHFAHPSPRDRIELCRSVRSDIRTELVRGAGHWLQYERSDEVNRLLIGFLEQPS
jgi:pimeloyl-ACP methyl ester carboxylesterase